MAPVETESAHNSSLSTHSTDDAREADGCLQRLWHRAFPSGFKSEFVIMLSLSWPAILTTFFQFFLQTTSIIMCGQLSKLDLDGVALASSFINVAGICIGVGMSTACDTLFSQTFGSSNKKRVGMYLQRSVLVMYSALVPLCCLHLNIRPLLLLLGQDPDIAYRAANYMLYFLPGLFFDFSFLILSRYLQNQNIMYPPMIAGLIGNAFNIISQYIALHVLHCGYRASALLQAASLAVMFIITLCYTIASGIYKQTWDGWQPEALCNWWDFVKLAVPGIFLIALEEWSFEVATVVAGVLGDVQLAAQSIIFQLESISYMIPFGMSVAVNIRVGQQLGAQQPLGAVQSYRVGLFMVAFTSVIMCCIFLSMKNLLPLIFTQDKQIIATAAKVIPILGIFQVADSLSATSCGAIRGCGRQLQGALLLFVGFYVLGLPIGIPLAMLTELQVLGMWLGLVVGMTVEAIAFCWIVMRLDWDKEVGKAQLRAYGNGRIAEVQPTAIDHENSTAQSVAATEYSPLISNSYQHEVEFHSHPGPASQRARTRKMSLASLYTGRFYSHSVLGSVELRNQNRDDTAGPFVTLGTPKMTSILLKRLLLLLFLAALFAAAIIMRIYTDSVLLPINQNSTATNASSIASIV